MTYQTAAKRRALILAAHAPHSVKKRSVVVVRPDATNDEVALALIAQQIIYVDVEAGVIRDAAGEIADRLQPSGYRRLTIGNGRRAESHRVVWLAAFGPIPPGKWEINHRNRDRVDNRIRNIELVLHVGNMDHWQGRDGYLRIGLDDEGAVDPRRLPDLLAGIKTQTASKRSKVLHGPRSNGVAVIARGRRR